MNKIFKDRGYPPHLIKRIQDQVPYTNRQKVLEQKTKGDCPYDTFLVTEYTPDLNISRLRAILKPSQEEEQHIPKTCLSLKKTKTIGRTIVRAKLKNQQTPTKSTTPISIATTPNLDGHSAGCKNNGCKCCGAMSRKCRITSNYNFRSFQ